MTKWTERKRIGEERLEICKKCEYIELDTLRCSQCGCFMEYKTKLPFSDCPLKKWDRYEEKGIK
jgi:hypothetical protein